MKVFLVGKERASGIRKDGSSYDNVFAHVNFSRRSIEGYGCDTVMLNPRKFPFDDLIIGAEYDFDRNSKGYVDYFDLV